MVVKIAAPCETLCNPGAPVMAIGPNNHPLSLVGANEGWLKIWLAYRCLASKRGNSILHVDPRDYRLSRDVAATWAGSAVSELYRANSQVVRKAHGANFLHGGDSAK